jgi:hypothetical protein
MLTALPETSGLSHSPSSSSFPIPRSLFLILLFFHFLLPFSRPLPFQIASYSIRRERGRGKEAWELRKLFAAFS